MKLTIAELVIRRTCGFRFAFLAMMALVVPKVSLRLSVRLDKQFWLRCLTTITPTRLRRLKSSAPRHRLKFVQPPSMLPRLSC